jgi:hypothetical protein
MGLWEVVEEGLWKRSVSLSVGCEGKSKFAFFTCDTKGYKNKTLETETLWLLEDSIFYVFGAESQKCHPTKTSYKYL